ncbi:MAG: helix-turn-helix transcriptional regulator [Minicystis sp.]
MGRSSGSGPTFDGKEIAALRDAAQRLALVPMQGSPELILDAIAACVPVAAALIQVVNTDAPTMISGHAVRLPIEIVESYMSTPRAHLERALAPVVRSQDGDFWRAENLATSVREQLGVIDELDRHGLGEGAGYKALSRLAPTRGVDHVSLALITERRQTFQPKTGALLKKLGPSIRDALIRISLPLIASRPLLAQIMEAETTGFVVLAKDGSIREFNRRAHEIARLYGAVLGGLKGRRLMPEFVEQIVARISNGDAVHLLRGSTILEVRSLVVRAEVHHVPEDMRLLTMREIQLSLPAPVFTPVPGVALTRRQREIAELLVQTGLTYEAIGERLAIRAGTVRSVVPSIYRAYGVQSRTELVELHRRG